MGTFMVHGRNNLVPSQGIVNAGLSHRRLPEVKQEVAVLARVSDGPAEEELLDIGLDMQAEKL